jgi:EAL domain-containing protein (putative c-di-GMP-specific phosphodiesterase class I)/GGDEF domain-containing protein
MEMPQNVKLDAPARPAAAEASIPQLSDLLPAVRERFDRRGVLGLFLIDASFLEQVERKAGREARAQVLETFSEIVAEATRQRLDTDDLVVSGEMGRNELIILLFRENCNASFFRQELPGLDQCLRRQLSKSPQQTFYPFLRMPPAIVTGSAMAIRNPKLGPDAQLRSVLCEAREDAELNVRVERRNTRRSFTEMLLDRRVYSVYEPIVEVESRVVFGYESLVRGPVDSEFHSPLALFGAAEREGLVFELDCLCRASGLEGAVDFPSGTKLFLNILPTTIHDPSFRAERLRKTLEECELSPTDVVFEISEQESIENFALFKEMRDYYRSMGFQFALDDTGSGYAGLEALLEIQPEFIKVDRAFVSGVDQDPARQHMLTALLNIAEKTGARVVGEGLDTLEELEMLRELGIQYGQGWLFGKPTPLRAKS